VSTRVSPLDRIRAQIDELFGSNQELGDVLEEVACLGVRLLMQTAVEAEVTEFLGRERYSHRQGVRPGSRNGHCPTTIKTTAGPVTIERPKLRGTDEAFASRLLGVGVCRTNALESLVIAGFVRGLSVRDVEATLAEALGSEATLSKSTVSRICEAIKTEFDVWKKRDLSDVALSTCSWTAATSRCTLARRPSRCWPPGASTPTASRCWWGWRRRHRSPPTPGTTS
jgi:transposase-like protein